MTDLTELVDYAWNVIKGLDAFTADDLHVLENEIELHGKDRRIIGSILNSLRRQGKISPLTYVKSTREECNSRPVMKWRVNK
jgi:hypothetical protein